MADTQTNNTAPVMIARELSRHYTVSRGFLRGHADVKALNNVSFELQAGKTLAVVGESGSGKSTLARQLTLIEQPSGGSLQIGGVEIANADQSQLKALRPQVQMVFQSPYASLNPRKQIGAMLAEPLKLNTSLDAAAREEKVRAMMAKVGLRPEHYHRYPHMFSGGQRQRIAIARAMMLQPRIVIADEPTSALDVSIQAQILNLFMDLQQELGTAYVFISHNLAVVEHVADDVMVMYFGSTVEYGSKQAVFAKPLHPYTRALMSATPAIHAKDRGAKIKLEGELPSPLNPPSGCAFHGRCPYAAERCKSEVPQLRPFDGQLVACHRVEEITARPD
ncbi:dipeptide transport system ATP-binding protein [Andreprevotia lacus DSM 23236]|jgi:dipeptide transport system ATP-binding protein|uniref:Dipeptide transport system ATP-binding protein n=1 Tax=Andreprevotia lacus DSM 23236 TaxID=1121001 RepID=A0A1W1XRF0_9NEIS|nr:peptide ABC transporter ATP-binding protein [Andreprevotia lacus]SMC26559.1 dipeptide transport system ATP-binding protein [Andreprevotia lacus DSM 23236]